MRACYAWPAVRPTILLFDIDGTLIDSTGIGRVALEDAFDALYGRRDAISSFRLDGMTDPAIVRKGLAAIGENVSEAAMAEVLSRYLTRLEHHVAQVPLERYIVHRGVRATVDRAHAAGYAVGLGTGNVVPGARIKLSRVELFSRFDFGGYGSDAEDRPTLIRRGAERGAEKLGLPLSKCRVIVIGDTPKDIDAASAIGADCLAVATGHYDVAALDGHGCYRAVEHLETDEAQEALFSTSSR
jgi:phosphoglycolate phosphatase-like HAD superfamily hydrolase